MRDEKKLIIQEKEIQNLREQLQEKKNYISDLENENDELKSKLNAAHTNYVFLKNQAKDTIDGFRDELKKLKFTRDEYNKLMKDIKAERKQYANKITNLLKKIENQK